jgi:hypothetical protein
MEINTYCPGCGNGLFLDAHPPAGSVPCRRCGGGREAKGVGRSAPDGSVTACGFCGGSEFYRQKDFNRKLGLIILVLGFGSALCGAALLGDLWFFWILIGMAVLDLALYRLLPEVQVCYACQAIYRGIPIPSSVEAFDLALHDQYAFKDKKPGSAAEPQGRG